MIAAAVVYLWMTVPDGKVVARKWPDEGRPLAMGSLVKPFTALAYAQSHAFAYPESVCRRCWSARAHGRVDMVRALAVSCNRYFEGLAGEATGIQNVAARFGLPEPPSLERDELIGRAGNWRMTPAAILRAYMELASRGSEPGVGPILAGLRESARTGTGRAAGLDALVKTGTAGCAHGKGPGDGYAVVLYPADHPQSALLVSVHARPGSEAAATAGVLIRKGRGGSPRPSVLSAQ